MDPRTLFYVVNYLDQFPDLENIVKSLKERVKTKQCFELDLFPKRLAFGVGPVQSSYEDVCISMLPGEPNFLTKKDKLPEEMNKTERWILNTQCGLCEPYNYFEMIEWKKSFIGHRHLYMRNRLEPIRALALHEDLVLTGGNDKQVKIWNLNTGKLLFTFPDHPGKITHIHIAKSSFVISSCKKGHVKIWDLLTGDRIQTLLSCESQIFNVLTLGQMILVTTIRGDLLFYHENALYGSENVLAKEIYLNLNVYSVASSECYVAIGCSEGTITIVDLQLLQIIDQFKRGSKNVVQVEWSSDHDKLLSLGEFLVIWKFKHTQNLSENKSNCIIRENSITYACWSSLGTYIFASVPSEILIINSQSFSTSNRIKTESDVYMIKPHPSNENIFLSIDESSCVVQWNQSTKVKQYEETSSNIYMEGLSVRIIKVEWSADGYSFVLTSQQGSFSIYGLTPTTCYNTSPIQQFFEYEYSDSSSVLLKNMHDELYKKQPPISSYFQSNTLAAEPASVEELERQGVEEERILNGHYAESSSPDLRDLLEVEVDILCPRCKSTLEISEWCPECGKTFHPECLELAGISKYCFVCYKTMYKRTDILQNKKKTIDRIPVLQSNTQQFYPQIGDEVVFFLQGYELLLKTYTNLPLPDPRILEVTDLYYMKITDISYLWPSTENTILLELSLEIIGGETYKVVFHPSSKLPSYLVLKDVFDGKLKSVYFWVQNNQTVMLENGVEVEVKDILPKERAFPDSPWQTIVIAEGRSSFWEIATGSINLPLAVVDSQIPQVCAKLDNIIDANWKTDLKKIMVPIDLHTIKNRVFNKYYRSVEALRHDVEVLFKNSQETHGKRHRVSCKIYDKLLSIVNHDIALSADLVEIEYLCTHLDKPISDRCGYSYPLNAAQCLPRVVRYQAPRKKLVKKSLKRSKETYYVPTKKINYD